MINFAIEQLKTVEENLRQLMMFLESAEMAPNIQANAAGKKDVKSRKFKKAS
jgi:hypothetical protein